MFAVLVVAWAVGVLIADYVKYRQRKNKKLEAAKESK